MQLFLGLKISEHVIWCNFWIGLERQKIKPTKRSRLAWQNLQSWVDGWMGVKTVLRTAYSNQKVERLGLTNTFIKQFMIKFSL